ncbi:MAG TPA: NAD(P)-dependent alcohol dehydrogenase [Anaerolineales bacterium]|jgi:NADPH:quinone reductase-like Zn-dependent oxidoreductase|nr:NAD(P)-dependent alcohol dehydrogenase [Anaerolineales bacterium]
MKAVVRYQYGSPDVLKLAEVEKPTPSGDEVLIKIHAVSINGSDREGLIGKPLYARIGGFRKPGYPILGSDIAGHVERTGKTITQFRPGDEVLGEIPGYHGGFAEYACAPEKTLIKKPESLTFEEAAAIPQGGMLALYGIREKGQVQSGQQVLINGAGGSAGTFAVQLAKLHGAEVTGVDHTGKLAFLTSLGADHVIDYTRQDFTKTGKQYDLILDLIAHRSVFAYQRALKPNGTAFFVGGSVGTLFQVLLLGPWIKRTAGKNVRILMVPQNHKDLLVITELCVAGKIIPVIDRRFTFNEAPEALRYVAEGRAKGKVVITVP